MQLCKAYTSCIGLVRTLYARQREYFAARQQHHLYLIHACGATVLPLACGFCYEGMAVIFPEGAN
jgi:hypothetical protein